MGLLEIGYHLIIDRDGAVHRLRDVRSVGSHCPAYNATSVGVCLIGGMGPEGPENNFTGFQHLSLHAICGGFFREWPHGRVRGHNELKGYSEQGRKPCPCLDMAVVRAWQTDVEGPTLSQMTDHTPSHPRPKPKEHIEP